MVTHHKELAAGKWLQMTLAEQMGNIGSEVHRSINWLLKKDERFKSAFERALELFDLTLEDNRWKGRYKEICRSRELFCTMMLEPESFKNLEKDLNQLDMYFTQFAIKSRMNR